LRQYVYGDNSNWTVDVANTPALDSRGYTISKTLGGLHRVAVNLTLAATPFDLQAIADALQGNATRALDNSALSGGAALPIRTLFAHGGTARVDPLAARGGLLQQLASSGARIVHLPLLASWGAAWMISRKSRRHQSEEASAHICCLSYC